LHEGLEAFVPSGWPRLGFDLLRVLDFTAPLWPAGFYNKTFIWPSWHAYEGFVRRMAGFGNAPDGPDPDRYDTRNVHCDVLVVGGGVAGLMAAIGAADGVSRVILVDQGLRLGGRAAWDGSVIDGIPGTLWARITSERLARIPNVQILTRTVAVSYHDRNVVALLETLPFEEARRGAPRERYWIVRANRIVLAAGAIEQPLVFCNNDRPGIVLAGAAHEYLRRYAVGVGRRVVVATNNDSAYKVARALKEAGIQVLALTDSRRDVPQACVDELHAASIPLLSRSIPVDTGGFSALSSVAVGRLSGDGNTVESVRQFSCDALAISGGWNPSLHLYAQAGGHLTYSDRCGVFAPVEDHPVVTLAEGSASPQTAGPRVSPAGNRRRQWVDFRHDVTVADIELSLRENFSSVEHVKRYTTTGMSVDQGKTSHCATLDVIGRARGVKSSALGYTTLRPPFVPVTLGAIVGRSVGERFAPSRRLPMHDWHAANGGVMEDFGEWKRPAVYLRDGETRHDGVMREARSVRSAAGLFDGSSLGKIEVHGPDALEFVNRFYINNLKTLIPGRVRYGLMLRESGVLFDDGTIVLLAPDRVLLTTTSGNAGRVASWLEEWHQCEWPHLRIAVVPVTDQWAVVSLAGPRARDILSTLDSNIDYSNVAFPHLTMREGRLLGHPARVYRVSFTGELTYEICVPAEAGQAVWDRLLSAGKPHGLQPFGIDALMLMRLEKGFLHIGSDTDGTTVPDDVGWGKVASNKIADFIGKRSLMLPEHVRSDRFQLIGLVSTEDIVVGSHLRTSGSKEATDGWVTSAGRSVLTAEPIALAMLRAGRQHVGSHVSVHDMDRVTSAKVVNPPFLDPAGERMNA